MRLINVNTLKLEKFLDNNLPPYAILSHTWKDDEELTFRDIEEGRTSKLGIGSIKLQRCYEQAKQDGIGYIWMDTCCIDKTDSVELSEAINSMFRWYKKARICYAYLSDVPGEDKPRNTTSKFRKSRWFKRGWTLQELLAPQRLQFYSSDWRCLGTKGGMCNIVEMITGISRQFLLGIEQLGNASIAQRMSWAAQRETTREEDIAYCLLGIFGVAIPMIYGEGGEQAFFRLQEHIMRTTRDDSILAWDLSLTDPISSDATKVTPGRILAAAPSNFANCKHIVSREQVSTPIHSLDISGGSLRIYLSLLTTPAGETIGLLKCGPEDEVQKAVGIPLSNAKSTSSDEYIRPRGSHSVLLPMAVPNTSPKLIYIKHDSKSEISMDANQRYWFYGDGFAEINLDLIDVSPRSCWDKERALIMSRIESNGSTMCRTLARFRHTEEGSRDFVIVLEMDQQDSCVEPQCYVMICSRDTSLEDLAENARYMSQKVSERRIASNGILSISVTCESGTQGRIILIRPHVESSPPEVTSDATLELQELDLRLEFAKILEEEGQTNIENRELEQKVKEGSTRLEEKERELEVIEDELRRLTEKRRILVESRENGAQEIVLLNARQTEIKKKQEDVFKSQLYTQQRWGEIHHINYGGDSYESEAMDYQTLLRWAAKNGHEAILKQLLAIGHMDIDLNKDGRTPLSWAAEKGHEAVVQLLLATGQVDVNSKGIFNYTPLSWAAEKGHEAVVQLLLATGQVDVNSKDDFDHTPLSWAAEKGHEAVVQLLLATGQVDVNSKDDFNPTPLSWAARNGHEAVVQLLLATGQVDVNSKDIFNHTPLSWAAEKGHEAVVQLLLTTYQVDVDSQDNNGQTPLSRAAENGREVVVQLLLTTGQVDVDSKDNSGQTPLAWAAWNGHKAVVQLLLTTGQVDVDLKFNNGQTPLSWAAENGHDVVVQLLLTTGQVDVDSKDNSSRTPLSWAAENGHEAVVQLLLTSQVDVDSKDNSSRTPLSWAAENGHEAVVQLLLTTGQVDVDSKDNSSRTPLSWAAENGHEAVVQLLLTSQVDVDSKDNSSRTPLSWAAENGHEAVVQLLLTTGQVDVDSKDNSSRTPLSWAAENGHKAVVQLLLTKLLRKYIS